MTVEELCSFPLPPRSIDCYLFLWRVAAMQREALAVAESWGFVIKSEIVWRKLTATGKEWFGMGRHVRASHEVCLIGTRGKPHPKVRNIRSVFSARVGEHSAKPVEFYSLIEGLARGPYVELFARYRRKGWTQYGNQLPTIE